MYLNLSFCNKNSPAWGYPRLKSRGFTPLALARRIFRLNFRPKGRKLSNSYGLLQILLWLTRAPVQWGVRPEARNSHLRYMVSQIWLVCF